MTNHLKIWIPGKLGYKYKDKTYDKDHSRCNLIRKGTKM